MVSPAEYFPITQVNLHVRNIANTHQWESEV